ncbi:MAG: protein kinase [Anaerolineae bacterium]|jgi:serine/threonine-protein kinase|nr:protein kinase [Anaerolineae bacterium]
MQFRDFSGQTFGNYTLIELIGQGGMGTVYRARQTNLNVDRAVKVLPAEFAKQPGYVERFNREAETAAALEHPNIVPVFDYGTQRGNTYLVMRLLTGGTLSDRMIQRHQSKNPLPSLGEVAQMLQQVASGLDYAHKRGVIHRDIKDSNIMFDDQGNAYIADFGIAKLMDATTGLTSTGMTIGTPTYMPPEQWRNEELTPAADQYALGVLVYRLLSGQPPFAAATPFQLMHKHLYEDAEAVHVIRDDLSPEITEVLAQAMAKDAEDRYPSVGAFAHAFSRAVAADSGVANGFFTEPVNRKKIDRTLLAPPTPSGTRSRPSISLPTIDPRSVDRRYVFGGVIAIALVLIGLMGALALNSNSSTDTTPEVIAQINTDLPTDTLAPTVESSPTLIETIISPTFTFTPTITFTPSATSTVRPTASIRGAGLIFTANGTTSSEVIEGEAIDAKREARYLIADGGQNAEQPAVLYLMPDTALTIDDIDENDLDLLLEPEGAVFIENGQYAQNGVLVILKEDRNVRFTSNSACLSVAYRPFTKQVTFSCYDGQCQLQITDQEHQLTEGQQFTIDLNRLDETIDDSTPIDYAEALRFYDLTRDLRDLQAIPACLIALVDSDQDQVFGDSDQCPDQVGSRATNGCGSTLTATPDGTQRTPTRTPSDQRATSTPRPTQAGDRDFDGVADPIDACPDQGSQGHGVDRRGCPIVPTAVGQDSDGDGIPDSRDACPRRGNEGQGVDSTGCPNPTPIPDTDGDGIPDPSDSCPRRGNEGHGIDSTGCPNPPPPADSDGDGVIDPNDACPNQGSVGYGVYGNGCPILDADGDGVPDPNDSCPNQGSNGYGVDGSGCPLPPPDRDGDGVPDPSDSCPDEGDQGYGIHGNGCPVIPPDSDGDGTPDPEDSCPFDPGPPQNSGCPGHIP